MAACPQRRRRPQRLLWASTGTKDPNASDVLYIQALAAPFTINTMPEATLKAFADHGQIGSIVPARRRRLRGRLGEVCTRQGLTSTPWLPSSRTKGPRSFVKSWNELMECIASKSETLKKVG